MLPDFIEAAEYIKRAKPAAKFVLVSPVADLKLPKWIDRAESVDALVNARSVLTKSGTITLELAVRGIPQVVAHRVHPMTHWLGRRLVRGIRHIAMPNILSNDAVVPEFIQRFTPEDLGEAILALPDHQPINLEALGPPGATLRAAETVSSTLEMA